MDCLFQSWRDFESAVMRTDDGAVASAKGKCWRFPRFPDILSAYSGANTENMSLQSPVRVRYRRALPGTGMAVLDLLIRCYTLHTIRADDPGLCPSR